MRRTRFGGLPCACVDEDAYATLATVYERGAACSCEACPVKRLLGSNEEEAIYEEEHASNGRKEERALPTRGGSGDELFRVVGYVDAVSPENDDSIVIEVKNRMHQVRAPELYDKLQVVTYLQMLGWSRGDLVQRVKDAPDAPVRVDRILRSDHSEDWARVVLPRLRAVAEAVLSLRADEGRRRAWLAASAYERKTTAAALCVFLPLPPEPVDDDADFWASAEAATQQAEEDAFWSQAADAADAAAAAERRRARRRSVPADSVASRLLRRRRRRAAAVDSVAARAKRRRRGGGVATCAGLVSHFLGRLRVQVRALARVRLGVFAQVQLVLVVDEGHGRRDLLRRQVGEELVDALRRDVERAHDERLLLGGDGVHLERRARAVKVLEHGLQRLDGALPDRVGLLAPAPAREPGGLVDVVQELVVVQHERDGELDRVPLQVFEFAGLDQARLLGRGLLDAQDEQQAVVRPVLRRVERLRDLRRQQGAAEAARMPRGGQAGAGRRVVTRCLPQGWLLGAAFVQALASSNQSFR